MQSNGPTSNQKMVHLLFLLRLLLIAECSIKWNIESDYVVIGNEVKLSCNGNNCPTYASRKWLGGNNYRLLCRDGVSTDTSKYEMMLPNNSSQFDLMIKNFNYTDINCEYTCACGFLQFTKKLEMKDINFMDPPKKNSIIDKSYANQGNYYMNITLRKVYPRPSCTVLYINEDGQHNVDTTMTVKNVSEGYLYHYTVVIQSAFRADKKQCRGNITLTCKLNTEDFTLITNSIDLCKDLHFQTLADFVVPVVAVSSSLTCIMCMLIMIVICKRKRRNTDSKNPQNTVVYVKSADSANTDEVINDETDDCKTAFISNEDV